MDWFLTLIRFDSTARTVLVLGLVAAFGLALGSIKYRGIGLGIAGVLFSGLIAGQLLGIGQGPADGHAAVMTSAQPGSTTAHEPAQSINRHVLEFAREFGLILFVYTIGVQVGPGFLASLRKQGLPLNIMAACIVLLGAITAVVIHKTTGTDIPTTVGLYSGGTTNTPSLAAAQRTLKDLSQSDIGERRTTQAYAIAYPFGIIGIIITMFAMRFIFRINPQKELEAWTKLSGDAGRDRTTMSLEVKNPNLEGIPLNRVPMLAESGVVISRILHKNKPRVPTATTLLHMGDVLLAVGEKERLAEFCLIVGQESAVDLKAIPSDITARRLLVTHRSALGKTVADLDFSRRFGVNVTRINRAEIDLPPHGTPFQYGDSVIVVGEQGAINQVKDVLGDSPKRLNHTEIIPVFVGIALGVLLGSIPIAIPGLSSPVKLGLAGGPLIVAIILSRLGNVGPLLWYMPISANFALREVGIVLFLAAVGINSGAGFFERAASMEGLRWVTMGACITLLPLLIVGLIARAFYKVNYLSLCGLLAGSMTDPPALAFAGAMTGSDAPSVSYATVYPLVMLLRVLTGQLIVNLFFM